VVWAHGRGLPAPSTRDPRWVSSGAGTAPARLVLRRAAAWVCACRRWPRPVGANLDIARRAQPGHCAFGPDIPEWESEARGRAVASSGGADRNRRSWGEGHRSLLAGGELGLVGWKDMTKVC